MKNMKKTPKCDNCGQRKLINPMDALPAMLEFVHKDGRHIKLCKDCIMKLGEMSDEESDAFFEGLGM